MHHFGRLHEWLEGCIRWVGNARIGRAGELMCHWEAPMQAKGRRRKVWKVKVQDGVDCNLVCGLCQDDESFVVRLKDGILRFCDSIVS